MLMRHCRKSVVKFKAGTGATVFSYVDEDDTTLTYVRQLAITDTLWFILFLSCRISI